MSRRTSLARGNGGTTSYGYTQASRLTSLVHNLEGPPPPEPARTSELCFASRQSGRELRARQAMDPASRQSGIQDLARGTEPAIGPGVAAWRDDDDLSQAARNVPNAEAGVVIPSVRFVLGLVAVHVVLLVPVNWFVFSRVGRAEWAWFAAPWIAVACSGYVVHSTGLDVGFVRTVSEVAVVEMQPGYARAHVTRYGALYNSLGHDYRFTGDDASLVVLPVAEAGVAAKDPNSAMLYERDDAAIGDAASRAALAGLRVASNSTALYRAEQLLDCGGRVRCTLVAPGRCRVENGTPWTLVDVQISGTYFAKAGRIGPGESVALEKRQAPAGDSSPRSTIPADRLRAALARCPSRAARNRLAHHCRCRDVAASRTQPGGRRRQETRPQGVSHDRHCPAQEPR